MSGQNTVEKSYEVVFFSKYRYGRRPSDHDVMTFFEKYGTVDHVESEEGKNFCLVFMSQLNTTLQHHRTRFTINQIIQDTDSLPDEDRPIVDVARRRKPRRNNNRYRNNNEEYRNNNEEYRNNQKDDEERNDGWNTVVSGRNKKQYREVASN